MSVTRRLGKVIIKIGSNRVESMPGATLDIGGEAATTQIGSNEVLGPSYAPKQSRMECTISQGTNTSKDDFQGGQIVTYSFECDTGQVYSCGQAWLIDTPSLQQDGWRLVYEGIPCEEVR
jgi:hypothetical protein